MYNKEYTGEKNLKNSDVFNSCTIWPADWFKCTKVARNLGYRYIDFNGNIYDLNDYNECEGINYKKTICEREDLIRG